jgi:hypothetical protein
VDYDTIQGFFLELGYEATLSEDGGQLEVIIPSSTNVLRVLGDWITKALEAAFDNEYRDMDTVREVTNALAMAEMRHGLNATYLTWPN